MYVVERLIESVSKLDYPKDKIEIQVLDDSSDESFGIAAAKISEVRARTGMKFHHIKREKREGYKAGALAFGLKKEALAACHLPVRKKY